MGFLYAALGYAQVHSSLLQALLHSIALFLMALSVVGCTQ